MISLQIPVPLDAIAAFCQRHHIKKMSLFGSVLRDDFRPESDVDVLVEFDGQAKKGVSLFLLGEIQAELSILLNRPIDLKTRGFISNAVYQLLSPTLVTVYPR